MQSPWDGGSMKGYPKGAPSPVTWDGWGDGPWAPLHQDPFRVHWCWNIENHQTDLLGEYVLAPSVLPCQQQEESMELCFELAQYMVRAGLQSGPALTEPTLQSRGCSHSHAWSPSAEPWGQRWPNIPRKTLQLGNQDQGGKEAFQV